MWAPVPEINYKGKHYNLSDGGLKNVSPLADAVAAAKADSGFDYRFIIINCHAYTIHRQDNASWDVINAAARSLEIIMSEIFNNDLESFIKKNKLAQENADVQNNRLKYFDHILIQPDTPDPQNSLNTEKEVINRRIKEGYEKARAVFAERGGSDDKI
jgi:NTE family protein